MNNCRGTMDKSRCVGIDLSRRLSARLDLNHHELVDRCSVSHRCSKQRGSSWSKGTSNSDILLQFTLLIRDSFS